VKEQKNVYYEDADVRFWKDENSQYIRLSKSLYFSTGFWMMIVGFFIAAALFVKLFDVLLFKSEGELTTIFFVGIAILIPGYFLYLIPSILYNGYFFRKGYIIQNQEELVFLYKPYYRFLDRKGKYRKVIQRADITQFIIDGSFGDICAVKGDEKTSIISNYYTVDYTKEEGGDTTKKIYIGMEEPLAEKICFKLNEFWGFDTTPPIADEQKMS
jgi:hypothetical protein